LDDVAWRELRIRGKRTGRSERVRAARADGHDRVLRLDHLAIAGDDEGRLLVGDAEQGLEPPERAIRAPVLGELDGGAREVSVLFQLALEALEERESIRGAAGEAREHLVSVQAANFLRVALHDRIADGHLAVAAHGDSA